jgi:hypothetical protein
MGWFRARDAAMAAGIAAAVFVATGASGQAQAPSQPVTRVPGPRPVLAGPVGTTTADVMIRHRRVTGEGRPVGAALLPVSMRLERRQVAGRWHTTFTFRDVAKPMVRTAGGLVPLENPFLVARLEFDEDQGELRLYDRVGRRLARSADADRQRFGITAAERGAGWDPRVFAAAPAASAATVRQASAAAFLAESRLAGARRSELQRHFGRATGRVGGLDRFLQIDGTRTQEILVNPEAALPVELNTLQQGALRERTELRYEPYGAFGHVRTFMRKEQTLPAPGAERVVTEVEMANVVVVTGGAL